LEAGFGPQESINASRYLIEQPFAKDAPSKMIELDEKRSATADYLFA
jgi:hypothetical protein